MFALQSCLNQLIALSDEAEKTASELGQDLKLYDRLNELSGTGGLDQMSSCPDVPPPAPPPPSDGFLPDPPPVGSGEFPALPTTEPPATFPPTTVTTSSAPPPTMTRPATTALFYSGRLAGPIGPNLYQPLRGPTVSKTLSNEVSKPYSNLHQTNVRSRATPESQIKKTSLPVTKPAAHASVPPEPVVIPSLPAESTDSEASLETRPFGYVQKENVEETCWSTCFAHQGGCIYDSTPNMDG
ncbi:unnamed protein product [Hydatigera taeniaeformis]|uniref:Olfactomedin-like domain-containing protein n=1 Tax=Hydatigena taeniaeformis TaxID=6205 RepID=A0A0R3X8H6_HYDTA|nr:unnamed protein product [Hydatigera taeniaeformis]